MTIIILLLLLLLLLNNGIVHKVSQTHYY